MPDPAALTAQEIAAAASAAQKAADGALAAAAQASEVAARLRPDALTRINTLVTVLAGIATLGLGVIARYGEMRLQKIAESSEQTQHEAEQIKKRLIALDERDRIEDASYKFAREFLTQVKDNLAANPRGTQLAVAALNIIAQASSSDTHDSPAVLRAELPLHMALLLGDPGSIAMLDPNGLHTKNWCDFAEADSDNRSRVTAIQALCALSRRAVQAGRLDLLDQDTERLETLLRLIDDQGDQDVLKQRSLALTAKNNLQTFLTNHDAEWRAGALPPPISAPQAPSSWGSPIASTRQRLPCKRRPPSCGSLIASRPRWRPQPVTPRPRLTTGFL